MQIQLRALSAGEVLDRTFLLFRARFIMFVGMAMVASALQTAGNALINLGGRSWVAQHRGSSLVTIWTSSSVVLTVAVSLVAFAVTYAAITRAVIAMHVGQPTGIAQAYRDVLPRWFRFIRLSVVAGIYSFWPFLLVLAAFGVQILLAPGYKTSSAAARAATLFGFAALEFAIAVPVCLWLFCRYALCNAVCVEEDTRIRASLKRSVLLSKGLRWRIVLLLFLVYIMAAILSVALTAPVLGILAHSRGHIPVGVTIYQLGVGFVTNSLLGPILSIGLTVIYLDARVRKEGFDIELMLRQQSVPDASTATPLTLGGAADLSLG